MSRQVREKSPLPSTAGAERVLRAARDAALNAYAPYSKFAVGAAAETTSGEIFVGANMENASYGVTMCAEVGALQAASTAGRLQDVVRLAVVGGPIKTAPNGVRARAVTPCGRCRQLILEASHLSHSDIDVWCADIDLTEVVNFKISELLPHAFGPLDLSLTPEWQELSRILRGRANRRPS